MIDVRYRAIDDAFERYLHSACEASLHWLLRQTIYTGSERRLLLPHLPVRPGMRVLDVGTAFGALAFDMAAYGCEVVGLDADPAMIGAAERIAADIAERESIGWDPAAVRFVCGDVYRLPFADNSYDFVSARFLFQHLKHPGAATAELVRVLRPGGSLCLMDSDDQLVIVYPASEAFDVLQRTFAEWQRLRGGDRTVGRKLSHYLEGAGLTVTGVAIVPQARHGASDSVESDGSLAVGRFRDARIEIVGAGLLTAVDFDRCLATLAAEGRRAEFATSAYVLATGCKDCASVKQNT